MKGSALNGENESETQRALILAGAELRCQTARTAGCLLFTSNLSDAHLYTQQCYLVVWGALHGKNAGVHKWGTKSSQQGENIYHRCLHLAARCLIAAAQCVWLHFLSCSRVICSASRIRSRPGRPRSASLPAAACVSPGWSPGAFIQRRKRRQMFTTVPLLGLNAPEFPGLEKAPPLLKEVHLHLSDKTRFLCGKTRQLSIFSP